MIFFIRVLFGFSIWILAFLDWGYGLIVVFLGLIFFEKFKSGRFFPHFLIFHNFLGLFLLFYYLSSLTIRNWAYIGLVGGFLNRLGIACWLNLFELFMGFELLSLNFIVLLVLNLNLGRSLHDFGFDLQSFKESLVLVFFGRLLGLGLLLDYCWFVGVDCEWISSWLNYLVVRLCIFFIVEHSYDIW